MQKKKMRFSSNFIQLKPAFSGNTNPNSINSFIEKIIVT